MIEFLNELDTAALLAINGYHTAFLDSFMMLFSERFTWVAMYAVVIWILFRSAPRRSAFLYLGMLILAVLMADQICASLIRPMVERLRPSNPENAISELVYIVDGYRGGMYGFPSCHAANSFALAVFIALFVKRRGFVVCIVCWALLNSYSRLYLGVHYPGDLLTGGIMGGIFAALCYLVATLIDHRFAHYFHGDALTNYSRDELRRRPIFAHLFAAGSRCPVAHISVTDLLIIIFFVTLLTITAMSLL
jgi:undecaprenyl-diphosphatase